MPEPLPNCPLCDEVPAGGASRTWCSNFDCMLSGDAIKTEAWRALSALRKPLTPDEADKLVWDHRMASEEAIAYGTNERWLLANAAGDALRDALTGKRQPHARRNTSG